MIATSTSAWAPLLDALFDEPTVGRCLVAPDGTVLRVNAEWLRSTGFTPDQVIGQDLVALFPQARDLALAMHARVRAGHTVQVPRHAQVVGGRETWWEGSIAPVPMEGGTGLLITARVVRAGVQVEATEVQPGDGEGRPPEDVTDRERVEEALRAREAQFQALIQELHSGVALIDGSGRFTLYNRRFLELFGLSRDADVANVNSQDWSAWQVFDEAGRFLELDDHPVRKAALTRQPVRGQLVAVRLPARGQLRWMIVSAEPVLAADRSISQIICTYYDVTERKHAEEALRASEERWNAAIESFSEGAIIATEAEQVIYWNPAARAMHGLASDQDGIGPLAETPRTFQLWTPDGTHQLALDEWPMRRIKRGERVRGLELRLRRPDQGWERIVTYSGSMVRTPSGERLIFLSVSDLTEQRRAEAALRDANRRKDEFLGMLSHELRNPLAPIRNSTYVLRQAPPGSEAALRAQRVIERQTEHLTRLVDDLLDVTRIARGRIELRRADVDLRDTVRRAGEDFRPPMDERGVSFRTALPHGPVQAHVDPTRVTQIVGNLLHNAAKFTRSGDEVTLSLVVDGGDAVVTVRDTGAGIEPALIDSIFDPFVQGERTLARTEGGLGLGLALVKGITELHGGTVTAASAGKGRGSEFVVRLPLARASAVAPAGSAAGPRPDRRPRSVLVVDDNRDAADTLADLVRLLGHEVEVAYDGAAAVEVVRARRPDVVLCDLGLPGMDGYAVARAIRADGGSGVRLVAVSGYAQPEDVQRARDAGFDAHVAKPPDPERLAALLG